jgi:HK97 family phage major capsid protein/HK97 family phage prohead protease
MNRAYSVITLKSIDEESRTFTGIATTPTPDRMQDVVEPTGAKFSLPIALLWQHDSKQPIGHVTAAKVGKDGITVTAKLASIAEPGKLKDRLDEAWQSLKSGLVRGLSIGFRGIETQDIKDTWGIRFVKWDWLELSAVTIPANADCSITSIKAVDTAARAALGLTRDGPAGPDPLPGASGTKHPASGGFSFSRSKGTTVKTIQEQIAGLEAERLAKAARMGEIMQKSADEGRSTDEAEAEEFDGLKADVAKADQDLARLRDLEALNIAKATPITEKAGTTERSAAEVRGGVLSVRRNIEKGTAFTRYALALIRTKGNPYEANQFVQSMIAQKQWDNTPEVGMVLKAASDAGTTTDADWASKLVYYQDMQNEFVDLLRPMTIVGKFGSNGIPALHMLPFNVRMATQTGGGTYGWVGEGAPDAVGELVIGEITMRWAKAAGILVVSDEAARFTNPKVEAVVRNDMLKGMAKFSDEQFISPQVFEVSNVSPASVTNLVTDVPASGTDAAALRTDLGTLFGKYWTANLAPTTGVFIMSNRQATGISLMRNALGQKEYPDMTPLGGTLEGFPVIASESVPDTSDGGMIVFVNADDIFFSDDGPVTIDASKEASLQMSTTPDATTSASTVLVSMWQRNLVALRATRYMNWKKRRAAAVQYISGTAYK